MAKVKDVIDLINCDLVILEKIEGFNTMIVRISGSFVNQLDALLSEKLLNAEISSNLSRSDTSSGSSSSIS